MALTKIRKSVLSTSYTELGLGNIALQSKNDVEITGGYLDNVVLGSVTPVTLKSTGITDTATTNQVQVTNAGTSVTNELSANRYRGNNTFTVNNVNNGVLTNLVDMSTILSPGDTAIVNIAVGALGDENNIVPKIVLLVQRNSSGYSVSTLGTQPIANYIDEVGSNYASSGNNENYGSMLKIKLNYVAGAHLVKGQFFILSYN